MSLVPASLEVTFTANLAGAHRICYRIGGSGSYTCTSVTASLGLNVVELDIYVDNETCDDVTYNGYAQASCIDPDSTQDRIAFSTTFTPNPQCKSFNVTCLRLAVASIAVTSGGSGYNPLSPPLVTIVGNGTATATAVVGSGALSGGVITNAGSGYSNGVHTGIDITGGTGTGAKATVTVSGTAVTAITVTTAGTGYTGNPSYAINLAAPIDAEFTFTTNYGKVTSIAVVSSNLFTEVPTVDVAPGTTPATATATLEDCPLFNSPGCEGADEDIAAGTLDLGESLVICGLTTPSIPVNYDIAQVGNCVCGCTTATLGISGTTSSQVRYYLTACGGEPRTGILTVGGSPSSLVACIVSGSLVFELISGSASGTVSYGASCS